jgi:hypothetical protein
MRIDGRSRSAVSLQRTADVTVCVWAAEDEDGC